MRTFFQQYLCKVFCTLGLSRGHSNSNIMLCWDNLPHSWYNLMSLENEWKSFCRKCIILPFQDPAGLSMTFLHHLVISVLELCLYQSRKWAGVIPRISWLLGTASGVLCLPSHTGASPGKAVIGIWWNFTLGVNDYGSFELPAWA